MTRYTEDDHPVIRSLLQPGEQVQHQAQALDAVIAVTDRRLAVVEAERVALAIDITSSGASSSISRRHVQRRGDRSGGPAGRAAVARRRSRALRRGRKPARHGRSPLGRRRLTIASSAGAPRYRRDAFRAADGRAPVRSRPIERWADARRRPWRSTATGLRGLSATDRTGRGDGHRPGERRGRHGRSPGHDRRRTDRRFHESHWDDRIGSWQERDRGQAKSARSRSPDVSVRVGLLDRQVNRDGGREDSFGFGKGVQRVFSRTQSMDDLEDAFDALRARDHPRTSSSRQLEDRSVTT